MKKGDLVRVIEQPSNQTIPLKGAICIISDIGGYAVQIDRIYPPGSGTVHVSYLDKITVSEAINNTYRCFGGAYIREFLKTNHPKEYEEATFINKLEQVVGLDNLPFEIAPNPNSFVFAPADKIAPTDGNELPTVSSDVMKKVKEYGQLSHTDRAQYGMQPGQPLQNITIVPTKRVCPDCHGTGKITLLISTVKCTNKQFHI